jgi:hypothetical protein
MPLRLALALVAATARADLSNYTLYAQQDAPDASYAIARVGDCGDYAPSNGPCNATLLAAFCDATAGCCVFNTNGWLKTCANVSCGNALAPNGRVDSYVKDGGVGPPIPPFPEPPVADIEDDFYPPEEPAERAAAAPPPALVALGATWAVLAPAGGAAANVSVGDAIGDYVLVGTVAALPAPPPPGGWLGGPPPYAARGAPGAPAAVLERSFARWGFISFVTAAGEVARLRKGTGAVAGLSLPNYAALNANSTPGANDGGGYYARVSRNATDAIAARVLAEAPDGEASFLGAAKFLPPQRDYAVIGGIWSYDKYSVAPDGRIKAADDAIYVPGLRSADAGPGVLVFDPLTHLPSGAFSPSTNFSVQKNALVGGVLRVVSSASWEPAAAAGFEQLAFAPTWTVNGSALVRLRAAAGADAPPHTFAYFSASKAAGVAPLDAGDFYAALWLEAEGWRASLAPAAAYVLPGQEGARQADTATGALVASLSLYVGLQVRLMRTALCPPAAPAHCARNCDPNKPQLTGAPRPYTNHPAELRRRR